MSTTEIITGLICLTIGALLGFIISRTTSSGEKKYRQTEQRLQQAEQKLKDYQNDVTEHFIKTSELIDNLTQSYREVHEHMTTSAMHLTNPEISRQLINSGANVFLDPAKLNSDALAKSFQEPPKDYAPKSPEGILSESYGLSEEARFTLPPDYGIKVPDETPEDKDPTPKPL